MLIPKGRTIFFNEELHKYTDEFDNPYTSCTTLNGKYEKHKDFEAIAEACAKIGQNPRHPKFHKYRYKTKKQLLHEWGVETDNACEKGSIRHNYLENIIKSANGYKKNAKGFVDDRIYTLDSIIANHNYGSVNLEYFDKFDLATKYPKIYELIRGFVLMGYRVYAEIGVYDPEALVSGLIDVLLVNDNGDFIILDWKTNKAPMRFEAGYFEKDEFGCLTDKFIETDDRFEYPLQHLPCSTGYKYTMQLSNYAYMAEGFGFTCKGLILCHIRTIGQVADFYDTSKDIVELYDIDYLKDESKALFIDWTNKQNKNTQYKMFA